MPVVDAKGIVRAYIGLGSNLEDPVRQVQAAMTALGGLPGSRVVARSALYWSDPIGPPGQPRYVNAVVGAETGCTARALLSELQAIERQQGRVRKERWGARTLDLDLLVYGDTVIDTPGLTVPHPRMHERAFVLIPLQEIAPALSIPGLGTVADLCGALDQGGVSKIPGADDGG